MLQCRPSNYMAHKLNTVRNYSFNVHVSWRGNLEKFSPINVAQIWDIWLIKMNVPMLSKLHCDWVDHCITLIEFRNNLSFHWTCKRELSRTWRENKLLIWKTRRTTMRLPRWYVCPCQRSLQPQWSTAWIKCLQLVYIIAIVTVSSPTACLRL